MAKRSKQLLFTIATPVLAGLIFAAFIATRLMDPKPIVEPSFHGSTLSNWLAASDFWRGNTNAPVYHAVRAMGSNCLPYLLDQVLRKPDSEVSAVGNLKQRFLCLLPWTITPPRQIWPGESLLSNTERELSEYSGCSKLRMSGGPEFDQKCRAIRAFRILGSIGKPAIPQLTKALSDTNKTEAAACALAGIGTEALPSLAAWLNSKQPAVQVICVKAIAMSKEEGRIAVPALLKLTTARDNQLRAESYKALWSMNAGSPEVFSALMVGMNDSDQEVRYWSILGLPNFKGSAASAIPKLLTKLKDPEPLVNNAAAEVLVELDLNAAVKGGVVPFLIKTLEAADPTAKFSLIGVIQNLGKHGKPALPALRNECLSQDFLVREAASNTIQIISAAK